MLRWALVELDISFPPPSPIHGNWMGFCTNSNQMNQSRAMLTVFAGLLYGILPNSTSLYSPFQYYRFSHLLDYIPNLLLFPAVRNGSSLGVRVGNPRIEGFLGILHLNRIRFSLKLKVMNCFAAIHRAHGLFQFSCAIFLVWLSTRPTF
jgi:hypothetical protein